LPCATFKSNNTHPYCLRVCRQRLPGLSVLTRLLLLLLLLVLRVLLHRLLAAVVHLCLFLLLMWLLLLQQLLPLPQLLREVLLVLLLLQVVLRPLRLLEPRHAHRLYRRPNDGAPTEMTTVARRGAGAGV